MICLLAALFAPGISAWAAGWTPEAVIEAYVKNQYPWPEVEVGDVKLSAEQPREQPSAITVEKTPPGKAAFRMDFPGSRSIIATATIKAFDRVIMSRSGFRKGAFLKRGDVYETLMETSRIPKGAVRDAERVLGKQLIRSLLPNMAITDAMISETPVVKQGHKVMLAVEASGFLIKTQGETRQDASVGDYVRVVNLLSKKVVTGLLLDENTVRVEY